MNLIHDAIKNKFVREGYLPNYPYHLISDSEMCDAFLNDSSPCYFYDNYPCLSDELKEHYELLVEDIKYHIGKLKISTEPNPKLPDWIYSYMLDSVISINSTTADIHDLLVPMNVDNLDDIFTVEASKSCYNVSQEWLKKIPVSKLDHRHPTMFGEPHVIKSLRLKSVSV